MQNILTQWGAYYYLIVSRHNNHSEMVGKNSDIQIYNKKLTAIT